MIYCVVLNPCLDRSIGVDRLTLNYINRSSSVNTNWGGKGNNVGRVLHSLGIPCVIVGFAGGTTGEKMIHDLEAEGIKTDFIKIVGETRTNYVFTEVSGKNYFKVNEPGPLIHEDEQESFIQKIKEKTQPGDMWVFSGSLPLGVPPNYYEVCIREVQVQGGKAFLDSSGDSLKFGCLAKPFLIKPNLDELSELVGTTINSHSQLIHIIQNVISSDIKMVVVTDGNREICFAHDRKIISITPPSVSVKNTIGAGDCLLAGLLFGLYHDLPDPICYQWSVAIASASVMNEGVGVFDLKEAEKILHKLGDNPEFVKFESLIVESIPGLLMTSEEGSFARHTIVDRKPVILNNIINDNLFSPQIVSDVLKFKDELKQGHIEPINGRYWDTIFWNNEISKYKGKTWLEIPWFFAETLFYRRVLEIIEYYEPGDTFLVDPFSTQKNTQSETDLKKIENEWSKYPSEKSYSSFAFFFHASLWGNRADLSNITVQLSDHYDITGRDESEFLLIDHTKKVFDYIRDGVKRIDFINDNTGREFIFDLLLTDYLLKFYHTEKIVFNLKASPYFVSDVMLKDAYSTIIKLEESANLGIQTVGKRLQTYLNNGRLVLKDSPFWSSYFMYDEIPGLIKEDLTTSDLIFIKGDANYRRILGDRHWDFSKAVEEVNTSFPRPFVFLRTLKAEIVAGLGLKTIDLTRSKDPNWLIDGKWGIIQLVDK